MDVAIQFRKKAKFIYPSVLILFLIIVFVVFFFAVKFLYRNINKIFILDQKAVDAQLIKIDFDNFNYVMKKLELGVKSEEGIAPESR